MLRCMSTTLFPAWAARFAPPGGYGCDDDGDPMFGHHDCEVHFVLGGQKVLIK